MMYLKLTVFDIIGQRSFFLEILSDFLMVPQVSIFNLNMMPIQLELALWNYHDVFEVQIQNQLMKSKKRKRLTVILNNKPEFILAERYSLQKSHSKKIFKRIIVVLPISCYFLFQMTCKIFLSRNLESV
jgi:hypothetical protein